MRWPVVALRFPNASVKTSVKYVLFLLVHFGATFLLEFFVGVLKVPILHANMTLDSTCCFYPVFCTSSGCERQADKPTRLIY